MTSRRPNLMITFSNEEFIREKYGDDPASNPNLKPLIDSEELESKLNGFYIITESNIYPIKRCVKQRNGTLTNLADLFEDYAYQINVQIDLELTLCSNQKKILITKLSLSSSKRGKNER